MSVALSPSSQSVAAGVAATITLSFVPSGGTVNATFSDGGNGGTFSPLSFSGVSNNTSFTYTNATPRVAPPYTITATVSGGVSGVAVCTVAVTGTSLAVFAEDAPGADDLVKRRSTGIIAEIAPGFDRFDFRPPDVSTIAETSAPGEDALFKARWAAIFAEAFPPGDDHVFKPPVYIFSEYGPPGGDGVGDDPSLCDLRLRSKYCSDCNGGYNTGYGVIHLSDNNQVNFDPAPYISFSAVTVTPDPKSLSPISGIDVETLAEAAFAWWQPLDDFVSSQYANSSQKVGSILPDDLIAQIQYVLQYVAISLKVTLSGTAHIGTGQVVPDGSGGHRMRVLSDTSFPLNQEWDVFWNNSQGGTFGPSILTEKAGAGSQDGAECFEVNPGYDNSLSVQFPRAKQESTGGNVGSFVYQLTCQTIDSVDIEFTDGYYLYGAWHYECCEGGCPPCTTAATIPSGTCSNTCVSSSYVDCDDLPGSSTITGPVKAIADACTIASQIGCFVNVCVPCLTQAQIDANNYQGPYTVTIPTDRGCTVGARCLCEVLTGQFFISASRICDTTGFSSNPFNLQDSRGYYHETGDNSYRRSNFGSPKDVGWAVNSSITVPADRLLFDLRVDVDDRQTVVASYALQRTSDNSWDGAYLAKSDDDGATWSDPILAISGGKHPTIGIGHGDGTFIRQVVAAYVGPDGGPGVITAKYQDAGDTELSDAFNFKDGSDNDLSVKDDTFHIQQAHDDQARWMLHVVIHGGSGTSTWTSFDDCKTWTQVT